MTPEQQIIVAEARAQGIDPATALAWAQRESNFNPQAKSSKTIRGMYQMRGDLRAKYGVPDDADAGTQVRGWGASFKDLKGGMSRRLGRDVSDSEAYLGHHFGEGRAARMLRMDPGTDVNEVFTPYELQLNPHIGKAGTVGALNRDTVADIDRRRASFGGAGTERPDFSDQGAAPVQAEQQVAAATPYATSSKGTLPASLDFSEFAAA